MKPCMTLPENYKEIYTVDMQKNKKFAVLINVIALIIAVAMLIPAFFIVPLNSIFESMKDNPLFIFVKLGVMMVGMVAYLILHELVHGIFMKKFTGEKVRYGFTGLYAFAASDAYFDKIHYIIVALAPVVIWGIVLAVMSFLLPYDWFWVVYFIQVINMSGAAGDFFVTIKFFRMPKDILVHDSGAAMIVYSAEE